MEKNLASNLEPSSQKDSLPCSYVSLGCKGSKDPDVYKAICSIGCGAGCELKPVRSSLYITTGELF